MKKILYICCIALVSLSSCSEFLDVNQNENFPKDVEDRLILPAAQMSVASVYSAYYSVFGSFVVQHWAQNNTSSQYKTYETFTISKTDALTNFTYDELFSDGLADNEILLLKSESQENWGVYLMAATLKAYGFQYLVDLYDNVPYEEAFKGESEKIFNPKIDKGEDIYAAIYELLEDALSKDVSTFNKDNYKSFDLIGHGDLQKWTQFARSMQLRLLIRQSGVKGVKAQLATLLAGGNFLSSDASVYEYMDESDKLQVLFSNTNGKSNPLFESDQRGLNTTNNIRANAVFMYYLDVNSDPRKEALFTPVNDEYLGMISGSYDIISDVFKGPLVIAVPTLTPSMAVNLMTVAEVELLKAEAYLLLADEASAKAAYEAGVTASLARLGVASSASILLSGPYSWDATTNKLEAIIMQKWVDAADGQRGIEAFIEFNRTGFPKISPLSDKIPKGTDVNAGLADGDVYEAGSLIYSKMGSTDGKFPKRLPYPSLELNYNSNAKEYGTIGDAVVMNTEVWWNVK